MRYAGILLAVLVAAGCGDDEAPSPEPSRARVQRGATVLVDVEVDLAITARERTTGLRGRTTLAPSEGLVLAFPVASEVCLVNDGVPFPIDTIYADDDGAVVAVEPLDADDPTPHCHPDTRTVLEIVAGAASEVVPGDVLTVEP